MRLDTVCCVGHVAVAGCLGGTSAMSDSRGPGGHFGVCARPDTRGVLTDTGWTPSESDYPAALSGGWPRGSKDRRGGFAKTGSVFNLWSMIESILRGDGLNVLVCLI